MNIRDLVQTEHGIEELADVLNISIAEADGIARRVRSEIRDRHHSDIPLPAPSL